MERRLFAYVFKTIPDGNYSEILLLNSKIASIIWNRACLNNDTQTIMIASKLVN